MCEAADLHAARVTVDRDRVIAVGARDRHAVGRSVALTEVDLQAREVGSGQIADVHQVSPAEGLEVDGLDAREIHRHVADVSEEPNSVAVGRHMDLLGNIRPDELHRVVAVPAFDDVASVARIPGEGVVAGAHQGDVVALASVHRVVSVTAEQHVVAQAAEELVVSGAPVEREGDRLSREAGRRDVVVAVERP